MLTAPVDPTGLPTARSAFCRLGDRTNHRFSREPQDWAGRPAPPREDASKISVPQQQNADYKSVIAVPVMAGDRAFGVLAVDVPGPVDPTVAHVRLLQRLADALGTGHWALGTGRRSHCSFSSSALWPAP